MSDIWETNYNSTFFLSVGTILITAVSVCLGYALKSKCSSVKLCGGCIEIVRDIDAELDLEELGIQNQTNTIQPPIPLIPSLLPTNNSLVSNKDNIIRRSSIKNSKTLQGLLDTVKTDFKPDKSTKILDEIDIADLSYLLTMTFIGLNTQEQFKEKIQEMAKLNDVKLSDDKLVILTTKMIEFMRFLRSM